MKVRTILRKAGFYLLPVFYIMAGINHFLNPAFYYPLIPPYFGEPETLNLISGFAEVILGAGLLFPGLRHASAVGIILMLLAFVPAHVYMIELDGCAGDACLPLWAAWVRLVVIQPLLIYWVWSYRKFSTD